MHGNIKDISSKIFGSLKVIEYYDSDNYGARWLCKCKCGNNCIIRGYLLIRGSTKTCGCRSGINYNFSGKRFGKLKIIEDSGKREDRHILWNYICDCGKHGTIKSRYIIEGTSSCGCNRKIKKGLANFNKLYKAYEKDANYRNNKFELSKEEFKKITSSNCFYCGQQPKQISYKKHSNGAYLYNGIDRKNNNLGYTKSNSVPCCFICNRAKGNMEYKEFKKWIRRIKNNG